MPCPSSLLGGWLWIGLQPGQRRLSACDAACEAVARVEGPSSTDCAAPLLAGEARWQARATRSVHAPEGITVPPTDRGLLARLDALVELAADRHGLALLPGGRLAAAEARAAARAAGLTPTTREPRAVGPRRPRGRRPRPRWPHATRWSCCGPSARGSGCYGSAATGWRRPACATPGPRSTGGCGPALSTPPGASNQR